MHDLNNKKYYWQTIHFGVRFMMFNTTLNNISVIYHGGQFYWWRKSEFYERTINLSQVTDKLYHMKK